MVAHRPKLPGAPAQCCPCPIACTVPPLNVVGSLAPLLVGVGVAVTVMTVAVEPACNVWQEHNAEEVLLEPPPQVVQHSRLRKLR